MFINHWGWFAMTLFVLTTLLVISFLQHEGLHEVAAYKGLGFGASLRGVHSSCFVRICLIWTWKILEHSKKEIKILKWRQRGKGTWRRRSPLGQAWLGWGGATFCFVRWSFVSFPPLNIHIGEIVFSNKENVGIWMLKSGVNGQWKLSISTHDLLISLLLKKFLFLFISAARMWLGSSLEHHGVGLGVFKLVWVEQSPIQLVV